MKHNNNPVFPKNFFWGAFFLHILGGLLFGFCSRKRTECRCNRCGGEFSFYY